MLAEFAADENRTMAALSRLQSGGEDSYEAALGALSPEIRRGGHETLADTPDDDDEPEITRHTASLRSFLEAKWPPPFSA